MENHNRLAQQLGKQLQNGEKPDLSGDSILSFLESYKQNQEKQANSTSINSDKIWAGIEPVLERKSARIFTFNRIIYAVAAVLAIVALSFVFRFSSFLGETENKILAQTAQNYEHVQINNEAEITLRNYSTLKEIESESSVYAVELSGEAYFQVQKREEQVFKVITKHGFVEVLGTRFTVKSNQNETIVYLEEGKVRATSISNKNIILQPNEVIRLSENQTIERIENPNPKVYTAWLNNEILLNARSVSQVLGEIQQHYHISINFPKNRSFDKLSGVLRLESKEKVLSDLGLVLGGEFKKESENTFNWVNRD